MDDPGTEPKLKVLADIAHEIGNMLTVISGWAQLWEERDVSAPADNLPARYLYIGIGRIRHSLDRFAVRADTTSTDKTREAWKKTMVNTRSNGFSEVNINHLVEMTIAGLDPRVGTGYVVDTSLEPDPWPAIADYWALDIVLMNLLMDAATASAPGSHITVRTANFETREQLIGIDGTAAPGRYVAIAVRDSANSVTGDWFAGPQDGASRARYSSTGLPICRAIVREHGGLLQVSRSAAGEITSTVYLPALRTSPEATRSQTIPAEPTPSAASDRWHS